MAQLADVTKDDQPNILPHILRAEMADANNLLGLYEAILSSPSRGMDLQAEFSRLRLIVEQRAAADPQDLVREMLGRAIGTISYLILRATFYVEQLVQQHDVRCRQTSVVPLPAEVTQDLVPQLLAMHRHLVELVQLQATADRVYELAHAKHPEDDQSTSAPHPTKRANNGSNAEQLDRAKSATVTGPVPLTNGHTQSTLTANGSGMAPAPPRRFVTTDGEMVEIAEDGRFGGPSPFDQYTALCDESKAAAKLLAAQGRWPRS